ncbi:MAG: GGDEF domain-containing protein [Eubacterium sp.]|nr:GGDEF domain-containing protein [Eubacterium sp.]
MTHVTMTVDVKNRLEYEAEHDPLTGLYNRRAGETRIDEMIRSGNGGGFLIMDLDHFKMVNDTYGHKEGDNVLVSFAQILRSYTREDDIICRYGGDEFLIYYDNFKDVNALSERCRKIINATGLTGSMMLDDRMDSKFSVSIGVALAPEDGASFQDLLRNADKALYQIKQCGRSGFYFYQGNAGSLNDFDVDSYITNLIKVKEEFKEEKDSKGTYEIGYDDFRKLSRFMARNSVRNKIPVQMAIVSIEKTDQAEEGSNILMAEQILEMTVSETLRNSDAMARANSTQYLILLMNTSTENGRIAMERVLDRWNKNNSGYKISYEIQDITA